MLDESSGGFEAALNEAAGADSPAAPTSDVSTDTTPAAATVPPVDTPESDETRGSVPYARFEEVNRKYRDLEKWREQYGWAEGLDHGQLRDALSIFARMQQAPVAGVGELIQDLLQHPQYAAEARSQLGRWLSALRQQQAAQGATQPDEEIPQPGYIDQGTGARFYSADELQRVLDARERRWREQMEAQFHERLDPLAKDLEARQKEADHQQIVAHAYSVADTIFAQLKAKPHFNELKDEIATLIQDHPTWHPMEAYAEALASKKLPAIAQAERGKVLTDLQRKATATTQNPNRTPPSAPERYATFEEAIKGEFERLGVT